MNCKEESTRLLNESARLLNEIIALREEGRKQYSEFAEYARKVGYLPTRPVVPNHLPEVQADEGEC